MSLSRRVASREFGAAVLAVILVNSVLVGWSTYSTAAWIGFGLSACLWLFVVELSLKLLVAARSRTLGAFWRDGWNVFDFVVVAGSFVPAIGPAAPVLRVIRVLRVFRLVRSLPELRTIVTVLVRSVVSMKYITLLAAVMFFIYGVLGVQFFGQHLEEYATLHEALFTLFRVLTGDNWTDLRYAVADLPWGWKATAFHVSWILISTFLLINLIVGAVLNNYQQVQEAERLRERGEDTSDARLEALLAEVQSLLEARRHGAGRGPS